MNITETTDYNAEDAERADAKERAEQDAALAWWLAQAVEPPQVTCPECGYEDIEFGGHAEDCPR